MKTIFKIACLFLALLMFLFACEQEPKPLTSDPFVSDIDTLGVGPQALRVVPGTAWILETIDSLNLYEQMILSQNGTTSRESRFTSTTFMAWIFSRASDSLNLVQYLDNDTIYQTLSISNDSILISGGNGVSLAAYLNTQSLSVSNDTLKLTGGGSIELDRVNIKDFGATGDNVTDDGSSIQAAIDYAAGQKAVYVPPGDFKYSSDLEIPDEGLFLFGHSTSDDAALSSKLIYSGSGSALKLASGFTAGARKITIENIVIEGTSSAQYGVEFGVASVYGCKLDNVVISGFTGSGAYALHINAVYSSSFNNMRLWNNDNAIELTGVAQANIFSNSWIVDFENYGIHVNGMAGRNSFTDVIIDAPSGGYTGLIGVYQDEVSGATSGISLYRCHFEDNAQNILVDTGYFWLNSCILGNPGTSPDSLSDQATVFMSDIHGNTSTPMKLGQGSSWTRMTGRFNLPTSVDDGTIDAPATIIEVSSSVPTNINGVTTANTDRWEGEMALRFMDNNSTLLHNSGSSLARFLLQGGENWNPQEGDYILLKKYKFVAADARPYWFETGRYSTAGNITASKLTGGSSTTSDLSLQTTSAVGASGADMHFLVGNNGATEAMTILNSGNVGIGNPSPGAPLDIISGFPQLRVGSSTTNSVNKSGYVSQIHYDVGEQDLTLIRGSSTSSSSIVYVGGGTSLGNAATQVSIYTAGNTITTTGTERVRVRSSGEVSIGSTTDLGTEILQVTGDVIITGKIRLGAVDIINGTGSPEGAVTATAGSMYLNTSAGASTTLYIKESGAGNTGWIAK